MPPRLATLAVGLTLALVAATCGDDEDPPARTSSTTTESSTPSTAPSPEQEVEAAYLAYWEMLTRLSAAPNPEDPEIAQRATGEALGEVVDGLTTQQELGQRAEPGPQYQHSVLSVEVAGDRSTVRDCTVDDSRILNQAGEVVGGGEAATGLLEARLLLTDGAWKVDSIDTLDTWRGVVPCEG